MTRMRLNLIDDTGAVTMETPTYFLKMVAAAIGRGAVTTRDVIAGAGDFDPDFASRLLTAFDALHQSTESDSVVPPPEQPEVTAIVDETSRALGMQPIDRNLAIVNLPAKRIVQIASSTGSFPREGRGRMRRNNRGVAVYYRYRLPDDWTVVP